MSSANKQQKGIQAKDQQKDITAEIRMLLSDKTACTSSLGGLGDPTAPGSFEAPTINEISGAPRYTAGSSKDKTGLLQFDKFVVSGWTAATSNAVLLVKLSRVGDTGMSRDLQPDVITIKAKVSGGNITECFSISAFSDNLWKIGPNPSDINYMGGNVGIGTTTPAMKLDVAGEAKISSTGAPCSATNAGAMRYTGTMEYCDGSGTWKSLGGGTPSIDIYRCPQTISCDDGQVANGAWASFGCVGQVQSQSTCMNMWWNQASSSLQLCNNACSYLGKVRIN